MVENEGFNPVWKKYEVVCADSDTLSSDNLKAARASGTAITFYFNPTTTDCPDFNKKGARYV